MTLGVDSFVAERITIYPNPTQHTVNMQWDIAMQVEAVTLYGLDGKMILSETISEDSNTSVLDLSVATNGIYFIKITTQKGTFTEKIIKK